MVKNVLYSLAAVAAVYAGYKVYKGGKVVAQVMAEDLNPASSENVIYSNTPDAVKGGFMSFYGVLDSVGLLPR